MGYYNDKSDVYRLLAEDLREEHGEEPTGLWPWVVGVPLGIALFYVGLCLL